MRRGIRIAAVLVLAMAAGPAGALELWLARGPQCDDCASYQYAAQMRGYGFALQHAGRDIPILSIDKQILAADILQQLPDDVGPSAPDWPNTLTVLVMDVGRVVFAANIAESADALGIRHPEAVMFPPAHPAADHPSVRPADPAGTYYERHWNLEYFVDVALGRVPRRQRAGPVNLEAAQPASLSARNVILWGAAATPLQLSATTPEQLAQVREALERTEIGRVGSTRYLSLYGHGAAADGPDASRIVNGQIEFVRAEPRADLPGDAHSLNSVLTAVRELRGGRTLLVQAGHSSPAGSPLWGHGLTLQPQDLIRIREESADAMIMVSSTCHGAAFAPVLQCGFFATHPDEAADGCAVAPTAPADADNYLQWFFQRVTEHTAPRRGRPRPPPTLYEAHWHASTQLAAQRRTYTTTDALIDAYFATHPQRLPATMSVAEIRAAARMLSPVETDAAEALTEGLAPETMIPLTWHLEAGDTSDPRLDDPAASAPAERERIIGPDRLMLVSLARRIAYAAQHVDDPVFASASACEQQPLADFFDGGR